MIDQNENVLTSEEKIQMNDEFHSENYDKMSDGCLEKIGLEIY